MAKVIEFPIKNVILPNEVEDCLYEIAKAYVATLNFAFTECSSDNPTDEELTKIQEAVIMAYAKGLARAIDEMEDLSE